MSPESSPERDAELDRLRRLNQAYVAVFGELGKPTPYGELILADLELFTAFRRESLHLSADGRVDPFATIYTDGKQSVIKRIHERIKWRPPDVNDTPERRSPPDPTAPGTGA